MDFSQLLMGNVVADQSISSSFVTGARQTGTKSGSSNNISFGQVLGSRMNVSSAHTVSGTAVKAASQGSKVSSEPLYKSYRQARESLPRTEGQSHTYRSTNSSAGDKAVRADDNNDPKPEETAMTSSADVIQVLAQLLGVNQAELKMLLEENGISEEKMSISENTADTTLILSEMLGLDEGRKETLGKLLDIIKETAEINVSGQNISQETSYYADKTNNGRQLTGEASEKVNESATTGCGTSIEQLFSRISEKLDEYAQKLETNQNSVISEIENLLATMLEKSEAVKQSIPQLGQTTKEGADLLEGVTGPETDTSDKAVVKLEEINADNEKSDLQTRDDGNEHELFVKPVQQDNKNMQPVFTAINPDNTVTAAVEYNRAERQTLPAKEIISQIVEKAGVVITQDKSEMVMELKPESLGRISLKVVTENGIVMAKIVAENRQVQQVLETNLQILRDSMERQGINVQSLSVSVRQDGGSSNEERSQYRNSQGVSNKNGVSGARTLEGAITDFSGAAAVSNPYLWGSSTINLTA